jgi:aconitate hydratase
MGDAVYEIFRLAAVDGADRLPLSLKVLLENLLRTEDGRNITADDIRALAAWNPGAVPHHRDPVHPGAGAAGLHRRAGDGRPGHHA